MLLKYDMGLFCVLVLIATLFFLVRPYSPLFFNMSENGMSCFPKYKTWLIDYILCIDYVWVHQYFYVLFYVFVCL